MNKKIRNATKVVRDGIKYRSTLEAWTHNRLLKEGYDARFEEHTYQLTPVIEVNNKVLETYITKKSAGISTMKRVDKYSRITYTPDFIISSPKYPDNIVYIIECKGFPNDVYPYKRKLFFELLNNELSSVKHFFFEARNHEDIEKIIKLIKLNESTYKN